MHQRLGHRSIRSLLAGDTENVWQYIEFRVDPDPFFTSCHISTINKKPGSKTPINPRTPYKWMSMDIIPAISSISLTKDTTFSNYLLIVYAYSKIPKLYGMENITTEEVMDKLYIIQARFGKVDAFSWWDMEIIQTDAGTQFASKEFQDGLFVRGVLLELLAIEHQKMNGQV